MCIRDRLESILNAALEGEMDAHLSEDERMSGNRRNGKMQKQVQTSMGAVSYTHLDVYKRQIQLIKQPLLKLWRVDTYMIISPFIIRKIQSNRKDVYKRQ